MKVVVCHFAYYDLSLSFIYIFFNSEWDNTFKLWVIFTHALEVVGRGGETQLQVGENVFFNVALYRLKLV